MKCAVSGCTELALLEAAPIIPYKGDHSNLLQNGLCLRVDIHRLFDRFLMLIEPQTLRIVVSDKVKDEYYKEFAGKMLGLCKSNGACTDSVNHTTNTSELIHLK